MTCINPVTFVRHDKITGLYQRVTVPCGHCFACLHARRKAWTYRLFMEKRKSESSFFITLTYDDAHLPHNGVSKEDCQKFFKRLRKKIRFRYFLVSEYGDRFARPHYHFLLFSKKNLRLADTIHNVQDSWPNGNIQVGDVTIESIAYCSKYCLKERTIPNVVDPLTGEVIEFNKTFTLMSRIPGIGSEVLEDAKFIKDHFFSENNQFVDHLQGHKYLIPRFYRDKCFTVDNLNEYHEFISKFQEENNKKHHKEGVKDKNWLKQYERKEKRSRSRNFV